jgi:hypothetical protein
LKEDKTVELKNGGRYLFSFFAELEKGRDRIKYEIVQLTG